MSIFAKLRKSGVAEQPGKALWRATRVLAAGWVLLCLSCGSADGGPGTPDDTTAPGGITGLNTTPGDGKVTLSWTEPGDGDFHHVEISFDPPVDGVTQPISVPKGTQAYTIDGLDTDKQYTFTVTAVDSSGNKSDGTASEQVFPVDVPPGDVTGLAGTRKAGGKVTLFWTDPGDSDLDHIEITWDNGGDTPVIVAEGDGTWTSGDGDLTEGIAYTFTVTAVDAVEKKSDGVNTGPLTPDATAPSDVTGLAGTRKAGGKVTLSWTDPTDIDLNHIEITWDNGGDTPVTVLKGLQTWTSGDGDLTEGTPYTFTVTAGDAVGNKSAGTNTGPLTPDATPPGNVGSLAGTIDRGKVTLSWTEPTDGDFDHVEISFIPVEGAQPISVAKGTQTKEITGLANGTAYTFTVKAVDTVGNISAGETIARTPLASTGPVTVTFGGLPQEETITLNGVENTVSWSANTALTVSVTETFTAYRWALDGVVLPSETANSLTLYAGSLGVKTHSLTVFVTSGGHEYAKRVSFTVSP